MAGKKTSETVLYLAFWSLYGPLAVAMWYYEQASLLKLGIVLLIGLGIILGFLLWNRKPRRLSTKLPVEQVLECEDTLVGFRNLFSQDNHGGRTL